MDGAQWPKRTVHYVLDHWHRISGCLRRALKGWGANIGGEQKRLKKNLLLNIKFWDKEAEARDLSAGEWTIRYQFEENLMEIYKQEEIFWQKRERGGGMAFGGRCQHQLLSWGG